ncbi:MAG: OsmC family protein, partial [Pseudomonadota bacterium]
MATIGEDIIGQSPLPPFFKVVDPTVIDAPENRKGDALRTVVRSFSGFQKEALVRSAKTGDTWRFVSDEGPYLNGHDAACCPLAFLSVGMAASYMNEIMAYAEQKNVEIRKLKLVLDNLYTMKGSMPKRTMVGGAENIELKVEIDCDLEDDQLNSFLTDATFASPLNGLMRGRLDSLFKLSKNGSELGCNKVNELNSALLPDPETLFDTIEAR